MILINAVLKDLPSSGGMMGIRGRKERMEFAESFETAYHFRLLYTSGTYFPIKGALRYSYGGPWEVSHFPFVTVQLVVRFTNAFDMERRTKDTNFVIRLIRNPTEV